MIRVMIADDHNMFVEGIESILDGIDNIQVVAKCYTGLEVFEKIPHTPVDVILLDINLPRMNGLEVCQKLSKEYPDVKVLALSMHNEESFITEILKYGAQGYILKNTGKKELISAIEMIYNGQSYFSEEVTETIMKSLVNQRTGNKKTEARFIKSPFFRTADCINELTVKPVFFVIAETIERALSWCSESLIQN